MFADDVIFRNCAPLGLEGTFAGWIGALERILALAPAVIELLDLAVTLTDWGIRPPKQMALRAQPRHPPFGGCSSS